MESFLVLHRITTCERGNNYIYSPSLPTVEIPANKVKSRALVLQIDKFESSHSLSIPPQLGCVNPTLSFEKSLILVN